MADEETNDPHYADRRNFYKVEKWRRDGLRVELMLYASNHADKERCICALSSTGAHPTDDPPAHAGGGRVAAAPNVVLTTRSVTWAKATPDICLTFIVLLHASPRVVVNSRTCASTAPFPIFH